MSAVTASQLAVARATGWPLLLMIASEATRSDWVLAGRRTCAWGLGRTVDPATAAPPTTPRCRWARRERTEAIWVPKVVCPLMPLASLVMEIWQTWTFSGSWAPRSRLIQSPGQ